MDAERYRELIVQMVLGDLPGAELEEIEREIERRGAPGRAEADELRELVGSLALAAAPVDPPGALRDRILAAIPPAAAGRELDSSDDSPDIGPARSSGSRGRLWVWVAMAATLASLALGLKTLMIQQDLASTRAELQTARARGEAVDALRDSLSRIVQDVSTLVDANAITLSGTSPDIAGRARVFVDVENGRTLVLVADLPVLPLDQVYQLWSITGDQPTSAGVFRLERAGPAWIELGEETDLSAADLLAVTVERAPGVAAPTSSPILAGSL